MGLVSTHWWVGLVLGTWRFKGFYSSWPAGWWGYVHSQQAAWPGAPKDWCWLAGVQCRVKVLVSQRKDSQIVPASSPRSASGFGPSSFQIMASALGLGACEILCVPFKSRFSISHNPIALPKLSPTSLQNQTFWGLVLRLQSLMWGLNPLLLGENLCSCNYPPICGSPTWVYGSWLYCMSAPPTCLIVLFLFFLYIFSCRRSFLLGFRSFSLIVAL